MIIEQITNQTATCNVAEYNCGNCDEGWICDLLKQITTRSNAQFALVQGGNSPLTAVVVQISDPRVQGTIVHTRIPYGEWMVGFSLTCEAETAKKVAVVQSDCRWPDETDRYESATMRTCDELVARWNTLTEIEHQITAALHSSEAREDAVRRLWKAAGITHEYVPEFREEMYNYVIWRGHEHPGLVPYIMRSTNWRTDPWYPSHRLV